MSLSACLPHQMCCAGNVIHARHAVHSKHSKQACTSQLSQIQGSRGSFNSVQVARTICISCTNQGSFEFDRPAANHVLGKPSWPEMQQQVRSLRLSGKPQEVAAQEPP
jgi:hypothetical protein